MMMTTSSRWWRPWESRDITRQHQDARHAEDSQSQSAPPAKAAKLCSGFQHPVKIMWPKSKTFDYLYRSGQSLLANFPVQATLSFYDSKSDDEDEDEDDDDDENEDDAYARQGDYRDRRDDADDADDGAGDDGRAGVGSGSANCEFGASSNRGSTNIQQPGRRQQQQQQ